MSSETIIGDVVGKDKERGALMIQHPVLLETVYANDSRYVLMRDMLKDSREIVMPINAMNIMYSYQAAPEVEAYYRGCLPAFEKAKVAHIEMYKEMLKELAAGTIEQGMFEVADKKMLQPSSNTMN
jgi:hypothetical protein